MRDPLDELAALKEAGLHRELRWLQPTDLPHVILEDRKLLNFSSNDYLGLSHDEEVLAASREALARFGAGSASSRLISGSFTLQRELEERIAELKETSAALSFSNGYTTALGVLPSLLQRDDVVILDKLCHACLIDGARQSGATLRVYPHNNLAKLERLLAGAREKIASHGRLLVVTESVFSMDGDHAPLREIVALCEQYGSLLLVDEAHAIGVLGSTGQGLSQELGLQQRITFQMGTLGKAAGSAGGYLAADEPWIELLVNKARSLIYSTAPPPSQIAAAKAGIEIIASPRGEELRSRLWENRAYFAEQRGCVPPASPIVPLVVGDNEQALEAARSLLEAGFLVPAIRFPTVPRGTARLRITLSAAHHKEHIEALCEQLRHLNL